MSALPCRICGGEFVELACPHEELCADCVPLAPCHYCVLIADDERAEAMRKYEKERWLA